MKNRVIILALFIVLLLGACTDDLMVDTLRLDNKAADQTEIDGNISDQEEPLVEEPVIDENSSSQEEPLNGEPVIDENSSGQDLPVGNVGTEVAPFDWDVFIAQRAAWKQRALGQTGYYIFQRHNLSDSAFSIIKRYLIYHDALYTDRGSDGVDQSWTPRFMGVTMSEIYDIVYDLGITDTAALAAKGFTSFLIRYDDRFHYPQYIQITDNEGVVYTVYIVIVKRDIVQPPSVVTNRDPTEGQEEGKKLPLLITW
jgi:hypothetical protein